jgi:hypothetical protein
MVTVSADRHGGFSCINLLDRSTVRIRIDNVVRECQQPVNRKFRHMTSARGAPGSLALRTSGHHAGHAWPAVSAATGPGASARPA